MSIEAYRDFSAGLNLQDDPRDVPRGESPDCLNVYGGEDRTMQPRQGYTPVRCFPGFGGGPHQVTHLAAFTPRGGVTSLVTWGGAWQYQAYSGSMYGSGIGGALPYYSTDVRTKCKLELTVGTVVSGVTKSYITAFETSYVCTNGAMAPSYTLVASGNNEAFLGNDANPEGTRIFGKTTAAGTVSGCDNAIVTNAVADRYSLSINGVAGTIGVVYAIKYRYCNTVTYSYACIGGMPDTSTGAVYWIKTFASVPASLYASVAGATACTGAYQGAIFLYFSGIYKMGVTCTPIT